MVQTAGFDSIALSWMRQVPMKQESFFFERYTSQPCLDILMRMRMLHGSCAEIDFSFFKVAQVVVSSS